MGKGVSAISAYVRACVLVCGIGSRSSRKSGQAGCLPLSTQWAKGPMDIVPERPLRNMMGHKIISALRKNSPT